MEAGINKTETYQTLQTDVLKFFVSDPDKNKPSLIIIK